MDDENRKYKYGQFGYGKYVYTKEELAEMKDFFQNEIKLVFPNSIIKYIIQSGYYKLFVNKYQQTSKSLTECIKRGINI